MYFYLQNSCSDDQWSSTIDADNISENSNLDNPLNIFEPLRNWTPTLCFCRLIVPQTRCPGGCYNVSKLENRENFFFLLLFYTEHFFNKEHSFNKGFH